MFVFAPAQRWQENATSEQDFCFFLSPADELTRGHTRSLSEGNNEGRAETGLRCCRSSEVAFKDGL